MDKELLKIAKETKWKINAIDSVKSEISHIDGHSFGFGTSARDIDEYLRPITKTFLESKLKILEMELVGLLKGN